MHWMTDHRAKPTYTSWGDNELRQRLYHVPIKVCGKDRIEELAAASSFSDEILRIQQLSKRITIYCYPAFREENGLIEPGIILKLRIPELGAVEEAGKLHAKLFNLEPHECRYFGKEGIEELQQQLAQAEGRPGDWKEVEYSVELPWEPAAWEHILKNYEILQVANKEIADQLKAAGKIYRPGLPAEVAVSLQQLMKEMGVDATLVPSPTGQKGVFGFSVSSKINMDELTYRLEEFLRKVNGQKMEELLFHPIKGDAGDGQRIFSIQWFRPGSTIAEAGNDASLKDLAQLLRLGHGIMEDPFEGGKFKMNPRG